VTPHLGRPRAGGFDHPHALSQRNLFIAALTLVTFGVIWTVEVRW
jgi:hypothetical protein